jgi:hypothetical protein
MKIAITGHRKGIGQEFARQLGEQGHEIIGISRSDGENIRRTVHTASLIEPCDMFINNAISLYAQTELLFEVWHRWHQNDHSQHIWNISTQLCESTVDEHINGLTIRESMQYKNQKMSLEFAHRQLEAQPSKIKMELIRPPAVKTQSFSPPDSISAEHYVRQVLSEKGML